MKKQRKLILILAVVMSIAIAAGSTMAYLQDTDEDVNVMTLGNVYINQLEYERVATEGHELFNDQWESTGEEDKYGYIPDEIQLFTQAKPLYPAVFADGNIKWDERTGSNGDAHQQSWADVKGEITTGAPGSFQLFDDSVKNVIDKFVFVENTGTADAYVRTWFAFEQGSVAAEDFSNVIMTNTDKDHWEWETVATDVEIDGNKYVVRVATYKGPTSNPTGILAPGAISYVSLGQVYMRPEATNDDVIAIDGNQNGTYDILVLSQAVQAEGFADAATALSEAFGEEAPWTDEAKPQFPIMVHNAQELKDAMLIRDAEIFLAEDIIVDKDTPLQWGLYMFVANGREVTINLNGHNVIATEDAPTQMLYLFTTANGATLNIVGEGRMETRNKLAGILRAMNKNDQINVYGGEYYVSGEVWADAQPILYTNSGNIDVYGGTYLRAGHWCSNAEDLQGNRVSIVFHEGPIFIENNIQQGDSTRIKVEEGCVMEEIIIDGETWYQLVKK